MLHAARDREIDGLFQLFFRLIVQPMVMTGGGPVDSTMTMSYYIYTQGITFRNVGYSSAIALLYTFFMAAIALTLRKLMDVKD